MKKFLFEIFGFTGLLLSAMLGIAYAQTVYTSQDTSTAGPYGTKINTLALTAPRWTGWMRVDTKRTVCFDIAFVDIDASVTSVDMRCETGRTNAVVADAGFDMPVYTATAATGITNSTGSTIRQLASGGGAPGSSSWTWCVTNIPGPYIECLFTGQGVPAAGDTINVFARGITP
jgi:hypothetical protein